MDEEGKRNHIGKGIWPISGAVLGARTEKKLPFKVGTLSLEQS